MLYRIPSFTSLWLLTHEVMVRGVVESWARIIPRGRSPLKLRGFFGERRERNIAEAVRMHGGGST